jgi:hypothetical protein
VFQPHLLIFCDPVVTAYDKPMRTLDIVIEDASFAELDWVAQQAGLTPVEFARRATAAAVRHHRARLAALRDETGYEKSPVKADEFTVDPQDLTWADNASW